MPTHRIQSRNSLEFVTFLTADSGQDISNLRLSSVLVEETGPQAHGSTIIFRPEDADEAQSFTLSPTFDLSPGEGTPSPAVDPVVRHSAGEIQSVASFRGIEVQLRTLTGTANNKLDVTLQLSGGFPAFTARLASLSPDQPGSFCYLLPAAASLSNILLASSSFQNAEVRILAIGDAA